MHAQTLKHTPLSQFVGLALVLGLAASLALNAVMLNRSSDDAEVGAAPQADSSLLAKEQRFALKGGTAINLFVRDMPRLSVDLDLVFPDHTLPREQALVRIVSQPGAARAWVAWESPAERRGETRVFDVVGIDSTGWAT